VARKQPAGGSTCPWSQH